MTKKKSLKKSLFILLGTLLFLYLALLVPQTKPNLKPPEQNTPFIWNQDEYWASLEAQFKTARQKNKQTLASEIEIEISKLSKLSEQLRNPELNPEDPIFDKLQSQLFELAPKIAAYPSRMSDYILLVSQIRQQVKQHSIRWPVQSEKTHERLYKSLFGLRMATEEVLLQHPPNGGQALAMGANVSSQAPSIQIEGIQLHSGDLLVSRGGAATSALIARGNNYPGNFSHVALVYVDKKTNTPKIIESHIEIGVAISSIEKYLEDTKLRIMVLRLREDHPAVVKNPFVAHNAATHAYLSAQSQHTPYDFEMNFNDDSKLFCSEVASSAYGKNGISLWMKLSRLTTPGVFSWLSDFGVQHFETQAPSDLEYDPQLSVVAEWRDPELLFDDHVDNAVTDAMLEHADRGQKLKYNILMLPIARVIKLYSSILNLFNAPGPVPEGMTATAALKNQWYSQTHSRIKKQTLKQAKIFEQKNGYRPPYFQLCKIANKVSNNYFE